MKLVLFVIAIILNPNGLTPTWREIITKFSYFTSWWCLYFHKGTICELQMQRVLIENGNVIIEDLEKASRRRESDYISPLCNSWGYSTLYTGRRKKYFKVISICTLADIYTWYVPGTPFIEHLLYCHGLHVKSQY